MFKKIFLLTATVLFLSYASGISHAEEGLSLELAKAKVEAAASLVAAVGEAAFPKLKDPNGEFRFANGKGYIWIHNLQGVMVMHPISPELEGKDMLAYKDSGGFEFFVAMNELVRKHGAGWVVYMWPKPGRKYEELKGSYVKLVSKNGKDYVLGCGMYDINKDYIKAQMPQDIIYDSASGFK